MKDLLIAVKAALITAGYRVDVVPDPDAVFERVNPPFITLADGGTATEEEGINEETGILTVIISIYYPSSDIERAIAGSGHRDGLAKMESDLRTLLKDNLLSLADYESARPQPSTPSEAWGDEENPRFIRKQMSMRYTRVET